MAPQKDNNGKSITATDYAYRSILKIILSGKYKKEKNLNYAKLENMLGISKTPIIKALGLLEKEGFVTHLRNRGYFVTDDIIQPSDKNYDIRDLIKDEDNIRNSSKYFPHSLNSVIYEKIKAMILDMKVSPGQKLAYCDLENKFGVSKTPILNALSKLESEGYVYVKKNVGCFVKDLNPEEIIEVMEARACLEVSNVDLVMKQFNQKEFRKLEKIHKNYCHYHTEIFDRTKHSANSKFHIQLVRMGQNRFMEKYIKHIYEWLELRVRQDVFPPERIKQAEIQHDKIMEALRLGDGDLVRKLLKNHLEGTIKYHKAYTQRSNQTYTKHENERSEKEFDLTD